MSIMTHNGSFKYSPALVFKFACFVEKIHCQSFWLLRSFNPLPGQPMYFKERLSPKQREIRSEAEEEGLITNTDNCQVKAFIRSFVGKYKSVKMYTVKAVQISKTLLLKN